MKKVVMSLLIVCLLGVFVFSAWQLIGTLSEYHKGEQAYADLEQFISVPETVPRATTPVKATAPEAEETEPTQEPTMPEENPFPEVDFEALKAINPDVVGWIYIPDTKVNYPIVQGKDNDQYLKRLITGEYNSSGSIFLDAEVPRDFSGRNSIIYGHRMNNGSMFADIVKYKEQEFYDTHSTVMLLTPEGNYCVHLFSAYITDAWGDSWTISFVDETFDMWLQARQEASCFASDVVPSVTDKVLTLSTCTYETQDGRFVVHGILEKYPYS